MSTPNALDALKYVCPTEIDQLEYIIENLVTNEDLDDDDHRLQMLHAIEESMHRALQSQVTHRLAPAMAPGGEAVPHSNTYAAARLYSDGTPVYEDRHEPVIARDPGGDVYPTTHWYRDFYPLPGGDAA